MLISALQRNHSRWLIHNFPNQKPHEALLGLAEEIGELAHAHLKYEQGIRGYDKAKYMEEAGDAIGDIMIYLASYCNTNGFNMQLEVIRAWDEVRRRDWKKDPANG